MTSFYENAANQARITANYRVDIIVDGLKWWNNDAMTVGAVEPLPFFLRPHHADIPAILRDKCKMVLDALW
ncbi:hypothetical protein CDS [Bradyrhizobium sp. G22]|nr:hypothetical protein CDS [Bradyrhizobium sp. G22]